MIWGFGKAQLFLIYFMYCGAARGCSGDVLAQIIPMSQRDTQTSQRLLKKEAANCSEDAHQMNI